MRKRDRLLLFVGISANFATMLLAVRSLRPLWADGANFAFQLLSSGHVSLDDATFRRIGYLAQGAVLPFLSVLGFGGDGQSLGLPLFLFGFFYALHPFLSLWVCWRLCRQEAPLLILFPLASFALATQSTAAFAVGEVPWTLSFLWPTAFVLVLKDFGPRRALVFVVSCLAMAFSHESGLVCFAGLALIAATRARRTAAALAALGAGWLFYCAFFHHADLSGEFRSALLLMQWGKYSWMSLPVAAGFVFFGYFLGKDRSGRALESLLLGVGAGLLAYLLPLGEEGLRAAQHARVLAAPVATALALSMAWVAARGPRSWLTDSRAPSADSAVPVFITAALLLATAVHDLHLTSRWQGTLRQLKAVGEMRTIDRGRRCALIEPEGLELVTWSVPMLSLLLQGRVEPGWIVGIRNVHASDEREFCAQLKAGTIPMPGWNLAIDFSGSRIRMSWLRAAIQ